MIQLLTAEQDKAIQEQVAADLAQLEAGTHHIVDGVLVAK